MSGPVPTATLERALESALHDLSSLAPAGLAAIVRDGRVLSVRTFGSPHHDERPTTSRTVFRIASLSKSFLAATALGLRDDGLLDLAAPATGYVPQLAAARHRGRPVTISLADLLSNRSGLPEDNPWGDEHLGESRTDLMALVAAGLTLSAAPGTTYQYSNVGMSLVGRAIEAVTDERVEDVVAQRVLRPLGLEDTRWSAAGYATDAQVAGGFRTFDEGASFVPEPYVGSGALACIGSLFSTVADIARWVGFLASAFDAESPADGERILAARSRREMQRTQTVNPTRITRFADRPLLAAGYGYGLVVEDDEVFGRTVSHSGGLPGFSAHMRWHPASRLGAVCFGNSDAFPAWRVTAGALGDVLGALPTRFDESRVWPQTWRAAQRLDALVRAGAPITEARDLFSRNVLRDVPAAVRDARLREAFDRVGRPVAGAPELATRVLDAPEDSTLRWTVPTERGELTCRVHLMGLATPVVQAFEVA